MPGRRALRALALLLGPATATLAVWFAFGASRNLFSGYSESGRFLDLYPARLAAVVKTVLVNLLATGHGLPWIVPLVCLLAAPPLARRALVPLGTAAVLAAFFVFTYLHRAGGSVALDRLVRGPHLHSDRDACHGRGGLLGPGGRDPFSPGGLSAERPRIPIASAATRPPAEAARPSGQDGGR